ncbi:MAG: MBL fold metallo-hydrolase [Thermomicrobiales bacterium]
MASQIEPIACPYDGNGVVMSYFVAAPCQTLVDTGGAQHPAGPIADALTARGVELAAIQAVINTHGHWDHAGGNAAVSAASGAGVLIHEAGAPFLLDHRQHLDGYYTEAARALAQPEVAAAQRATFPTIFGPESVPNRLLRDGDRIDLGDGVVFQVVHVPGHSDDMSALWWEQEGVLLAGDAAQGTGSRPGSCPLYFGNIAQARASIKRLLDVPFGTLHVSHPFGRPGTTGRQATYDGPTGQAFLRDSLTALDIMEEALRDALRDNGEAEFPDLARAATAALQRANRWDITPDPLTGVPANAAPTLYRLWREIASA